MVAKLALFLIVLAIIIGLVTLFAFMYFREEAERNHEKELKEMEQVDKIFEKEDL